MSFQQQPAPRMTVAPMANSAEPPQAQILVESLQPGESDYLSAVVAGIPDLSWASYALADSQDSVPELLEENNHREFQVSP